MSVGAIMNRAEIKITIPMSFTRNVRVCKVIHNDFVMKLDTHGNYDHLRFPLPLPPYGHHWEIKERQGTLITLQVSEEWIEPGY